MQGVSLVIGFRIGSEDQTFAEFRCRTCWRVIGEVWTFGYIQFVYRFHFPCFKSTYKIPDLVIIHMLWKSNMKPMI